MMKKEDKKEKKEHVQACFLIDEDKLVKLDKAAKEKKWSRSTMIQEIIDQWLDKVE